MEKNIDDLTPDDLIKAIDDLFKELKENSLEPLPEFEKILNENLWGLYEE